MLHVARVESVIHAAEFVPCQLVANEDLDVLLTTSTLVYAPQRSFFTTFKVSILLVAEASSSIRMGQ